MKHNGDRCQPLERPHFVTGQILTADDLQAEQDYQREVRRRHNRLCHGWGIVEGLGVRWERLRLESWSGLDLRSVPGETRSVFSAHAELELGPRTATCRVGFVAVRATETFVSPVPVVDPEDPDAVRYSRVREGFELAVLDDLPSTHRHAPDRGSAVRVAWWWDAPPGVRIEAAWRSKGGDVAARSAGTPDDYWVVLAAIGRTRVDRDDDHLRVRADVRRSASL